MLFKDACAIYLPLKIGISFSLKKKIPNLKAIIHKQKRFIGLNYHPIITISFTNGPHSLMKFIHSQRKLYSKAILWA